MQRSGTLYTLFFAFVVCVVCSVLVSVCAVGLREKQQMKALVDRQRNVLSIAGFAKPGQRFSDRQVQSLFEKQVNMRVIDLETGEYAENEQELLRKPYDMRDAARDPSMSRKAPANPAQVRRIPKYATVYQVVNNGSVQMLILPVWGKGLWSTLYGFLALDNDCKTIEGLTFYEHGETPGLGGEVDSPRWKALWDGRLAYDRDWDVKIEVVKGKAGPADEDPYHVDGLSGATITSRSVTHLLHFWLSDHAYKPYLRNFLESRR
jgi:Na+-transporting NADH:ubiquinone oxidoreductase subunit C